MKIYVILTLLVALAFANSLQNSFVWDDQAFIVENPKINPPLKEIPLVFTTGLWKAAGVESRQVYYRPIVFLSYVLNYKICGPNPLGFHLTHIIFHLINTVVLYRIGLLLLDVTPPPSCLPAGTAAPPLKPLPSSPCQGEEKGEVGGRGSYELISLMAASLFAVHPVHSEPICFASSGEVILGFFIVLSLYFFLKRMTYLSWIAFFLALLSKEAAVMLPFSLAIFSVYKRGFKKGVIEILPYMIIVVLYLILRATIVDTVFGDRVTQSIFIRILTMVTATLDYIRLLVIPYPSSPFYPVRWYASISEPKAILAMILLMLILFLTYRMRGNRVMLFLLTFPLIMLAPVIWRTNTFPAGHDFTYIAERFLYVPAMSFSLFVSVSAAKFVGRKKHIIIVASPVMIIFMTLAISSNTTWKNDITLFKKITSESPTVVFAHNNLGRAYYFQKQFDEAIKEYKTVVALNPYSETAVIARTSLGAIYANQGFLPEAIQELLIVLQLNFNYATAHNCLGDVYYIQGRLNEALQEYIIALRLEPKNIKLYNSLGKIYIKLNKIDDAITNYRAALKINYISVETHYNLGLAYKQKGLINEAIHEFQEALRIQPTFIKARQNLESLRR